MRQGIRLAGLGSAIGLLLAAGAGTAVSSRWYGVPPPDALFAAALAVFAVVALAACYGAVRRATRTHAMDALRHE